MPLLLAVLLIAGAAFTGVLYTNNLYKPPIFSPLPIPIAIYSPQPVPTSSPNTYVDPDPITDCVSNHPNCNGFIIKAHKSQCNNIYCCGLSNGKWILLSTIEKCKQTSLATNESDPIVQCMSKTGTKTIRQSTCKTSVDCPNGSGGYFFTTDALCTEYWNKIKNEFVKLGNDYNYALQEQARLQQELFKLDSEKSNQRPTDYSDINQTYPTPPTIQDYTYPIRCPSPITARTGEVFYQESCSQ